MEPFIGIDFGTTNSAIGLVGPHGPPRLVEFPVPGGTAPTWRSVLYFEPVAGVREAGVSAGARAIERYLANEGEGRLILSIKSHLASRLFTRTRILGRTWTLEDLIATFLDQARAAVRAAGGPELGRRAVVGRPVRYWGARDDDDETRALTSMRAALSEAGFDEVVFEYEPVAAAARYAATLERDELVLIADFGGGTSDFSLVRIGPGTGRLDAGSDADSILATGGVGVGGDSFDGRVVDAAVAPLLGKGGEYEVAMGGRAPVPAWLFGHLRRWHQLSFLKTRQNLHLLDQIAHGADDPAAIARLIYVVEHDLGMPLHRAVEAAKIELSSQADGRLTLRRPPLVIDESIARDEFEAWIGEELGRIEAVIDEVLARAGVSAGEVDRVFATGGSSFVAAVRALLATRFGAERVVGGEELTSVAWGLAVRARQRFG
ncbi:Hsp70 family protein [Haliangium sp.]|uniref:Hsp70 family protein n=1 Tax=Haliangium sp. TaxID=2663208 RepID=UPI003D0D1823